jgi:hypothetical protein
VLKASELDFGSYFDLELDKGKRIINMEPNATIITAKIQLEEIEEPREGEHLFHSQM